MWDDKRKKNWEKMERGLKFSFSFLVDNDKY